MLRPERGTLACLVPMVSEDLPKRALKVGSCRTLSSSLLPSLTNPLRGVAAPAPLERAGLIVSKLSVPNLDLNSLEALEGTGDAATSKTSEPNFEGTPLPAPLSSAPKPVPNSLLEEEGAGDDALAPHTFEEVLRVRASADEIEPTTEMPRKEAIPAESMVMGL